MIAAVPGGSEQGLLPAQWVDWDQPVRTPSGMAYPTLAVAELEGPLDWILDMAASRQIDLRRVSIIALIDAFDAALTDALSAADRSTRDFARWGDWLVMAAQLTLLRSKLLLPDTAPDAQEARAEAETLRQQLLARADIRAAAAWLEAQPQLGRDVFARGCVDAGADDARGVAARDQPAGGLVALFQACLVALRIPEEIRCYRPASPPLWTADKALRHLRAALPDLAEDAPLNTLLPPIAEGAAFDTRCRAVIGSAFVACLELARQGEVALTQEEPWLPIHLRRAATPAVSVP
jgi:segregation and condensation protein A